MLSELWWYFIADIVVVAAVAAKFNAHIEPILRFQIGTLRFSDKPVASCTQIKQKQKYKCPTAFEVVIITLFQSQITEMSINLIKINFTH